MYSRIGTALAFFLVLSLTTVCGCTNKESMEMTLQALERGKAEGQLTLASDERLSISESVTFGVGAGKSSLAFSGRIDFSDKLNRQKAKENEN